MFLAKNKVDVWGMDYSWAFVPTGQKNFKFMKSWGIARDTQHAEIALALARAVRAATGQGSGRLEVLGFSYGGAIAYAAAGDETQQPRALRNIKGLISADMLMKFQEQFNRDYRCTLMAADQANLDAGIYSDDSGVFLKQLSDLAVSALEDPSPIFSGMTNYQAAEFLGTSTWLVDSNPIFGISLRDIWTRTAFPAICATPIPGCGETCLGTFHRISPCSQIGISTRCFAESTYPLTAISSRSRFPFSMLGPPVDSEPTATTRPR